MASDSKTSPVLMIGLLAAAVGAAYLYFKNACATPLAAGATWPPASICSMSLFAPVVAAAAAPAAAGTPTLGSQYVDPAVLPQMIATAAAKGLTPAQIQAQLNLIPAQFAACVAPGTWNLETAGCGYPTTGSGAPANPVDSATGNAWGNAIALMKQTAGNDAQNFDQWSWQFQYQPIPPGVTLPTGYGNQAYITPTIMQAIIDMGGGDRTQVITAETFVGYLQSALASAGLSGLGYELPVWLFHRGGVS